MFLFSQFLTPSPRPNKICHSWHLVLWCLYDHSYRFYFLNISGIHSFISTLLITLVHATIVAWLGNKLCLNLSIPYFLASLQSNLHIAARVTFVKWKSDHCYSSLYFKNSSSFLFLLGLRRDSLICLKGPAWSGLLQSYVLSHTCAFSLLLWYRRLHVTCLLTPGPLNTLVSTQNVLLIFLLVYS